jgi:hypothetical protein
MSWIGVVRVGRGGHGEDGKFFGIVKKGGFNSCHSAVVFFRRIGKHSELLDQMVVVGDVNVDGCCCNAGGMSVDFRS